MAEKYWLIKSEPNTFSIDDLNNKPKKTEHWDGVRNYQARNFMREMKKGDQAFFYHSSCKEPGIVGIVNIVKNPYPDFTSWDEKSPYFDIKSTPDAPRWFMVDVKFQKKLKDILPLQLLKSIKGLEDLPLVKKGTRLSIMPVTKKQWQIINKLDDN
jgi:predicted RNA-binding protein with PUA-like domain